MRQQPSPSSGPPPHSPDIAERAAWGSALTKLSIAAYAALYNHGFRAWTRCSRRVTSPTKSRRRFRATSSVGHRTDDLAPRMRSTYSREACIRVSTDIPDCFPDATSDPGTYLPSAHAGPAAARVGAGMAVPCLLCGSGLVSDDTAPQSKALRAHGRLGPEWRGARSTSPRCAVVSDITGRRSDEGSPSADASQRPGVVFSAGPLGGPLGLRRQYQHPGSSRPATWVARHFWNASGNGKRNPARASSASRELAARAGRCRLRSAAAMVASTSTPTTSPGSNSVTRFAFKGAPNTRSDFTRAWSTGCSSPTGLPSWCCPANRSRG